MNPRDLCIMSCIFCKAPDFQRWVHQQAEKRQILFIAGRLPSRSEAMAKAFILHECEVRSRNDLDRNKDAASRFHELVRKPFLEWQESQINGERPDKPQSRLGCGV